MTDAGRETGAGPGTDPGRPPGRVPWADPGEPPGGEPAAGVAGAGPDTDPGDRPGTAPVAVGVTDAVLSGGPVEPLEPTGSGDRTPVDPDSDPRGMAPLDTAGEPVDGPLADPARALAAVEAILFVTDEPIGAADLAAVLDLPVPRVKATLRDLAAGYDAAGRGIDLREVAGGWRLYTREELAPWVERYLLDGQRTRLTRAALETLAVIAYRQPVTRSRIAAIRGVGVDAVVRTLLTRGLVEECGTDPTTGGGLYQTTPLFLEKLGMRSLEELPPLAPLLPGLEAVDDVIDG